MDQRAERLQYEVTTSSQENRGPIHMDSWHWKGIYGQPREDRYKNIDRSTIRKFEHPNKVNNILTEKH